MMKAHQRIKGGLARSTGCWTLTGWSIKTFLRLGGWDPHWKTTWEYNMLSVHTQTHEMHHDRQHTHTYTHTPAHTHTHTIHHNHSAQKHTLDFTPITVRQNGTKHTEIHHASSRLFHYCVTMAVQPLQWTWYHCTAVGSLTAERDKTHTGNTPCSLYTPPLLHSELICWRVFHQ